jgi:thiamine biosynthesis lipoprotein ApbE
VRDDEDFLRLLTGRTIDDWAAMDFARAGIEGVSGATQTSFAVADGLRRRFAADHKARQETGASKRWNPGLLAIVAGGLAMTFTPLRTSRRVRVVWQGVLILAFFLWIGDLLSLALVVGWMRHGVPWFAAPAVVVLAAVALVTPWTTRRQIYCQQICPHGAAQSWLARFKRLHVRLPPGVQRWLASMRFIILAAGLGLAMVWPAFDLAWVEPFDGWVLKTGALVSAGIAIAGLVASLFVPQAYCRFACPTGELLAFIKCGGSHDRLGLRDWAAGGLIAAAAIAVALPVVLPASLRLAHEAPTAGQPEITEIGGKALGTTWSVKVRGACDAKALQTTVATELERIESTLSHWRPDSFTAQFNASETTLATEQPAELIVLVAHAQKLSRLTGGAYDITVAPLVDAWGFGPSGAKISPPTEAELAELLARTGWQKLEVNPEENTLRKTHPQLQIDLGSLLQGYAADRATRLLDQAGIAEFLVEVGGELFGRGAWEVAVEDPRRSQKPLCRLVLANRGLATSGLYRATQQLDTTVAHHLISPHTGRPVAATVTLAAVVAPTALEADAWSTALLAAGLPRGLHLADEHDLAALLVDLNHQQHHSQQGRDLFRPVGKPGTDAF